MNYLYIVATKKEVLVTIRIAESVRDEFKKAAELRGASMSGLMHQFIVRTIREEKAQSPQSFGNVVPATGRIVRARSMGELTNEAAPRKRKTG